MFSGFLDDKYASSEVEIKGCWEKIIFLDTGVLSSNSISPPFLRRNQHGIKSVTF